MKTEIQFTRVNCDKYANSRFVCHFTELVNEQEQKEALKEGIHYISTLYSIAVNKARKIGGSKYKGKEYGGGIVFTTPNPQDIEEKIKKIKNL
jgi:hypothetical protein